MKASHGTLKLVRVRFALLAALALVVLAGCIDANDGPWDLKNNVPKIQCCIFGSAGLARERFGRLHGYIGAGRAGGAADVLRRRGERQRRGCRDDIADCLAHARQGKWCCAAG